MKKIIMLLSFFIVTFTLGQTAMANYAWFQQGAYYQGVATYQANSTSFLENKYQYDSSFRAIANASSSAFANIQSSMYDLITAQMAGVSQYRGHSVSVGGKMGINFVGAGSYSHFNMNLPTIDASINFKQVVLIFVSITCSVQVHIEGMQAYGDIDVLGGNILNIYAKGTPNISQNCSGNIPIVGDLIANFAEGKIANLAQKITANFSTAKGFPISAYTFLGLNSSIKPGQYVINSFDVGLFIKNNLSTLIYNNSVSVSLSQPTGKPIGGAWDGQFKRVADEIARFSFPNQSLSLVINDIRDYEYDFYCPPGKYNCQIP